MSAASIHFAGEHLLLDPAGALIWPAAHLLAVADLHFEKGSAMATRGRLVPPWDTAATLDRLAALLRRYRPQTVLALGDSFHDAEGAGRMLPGAAARLAALVATVRFVWLHGNHDPAPPDGIDGEAAAEWRQGPFVFRHAASTAAPVPPGFGEISGHWHPKASIPSRAGHVTRPCFVADRRRVLLPAFGAYTGGLDVRHPAIAALFPRGGRVFLLGRERLFSFALGPLRARPAGDGAPSSGAGTTAAISSASMSIRHG